MRRRYLTVEVPAPRTASWLLCRLPGLRRRWRVATLRRVPTLLWLLVALRRRRVTLRGRRVSAGRRRAAALAAATAHRDVDRLLQHAEVTEYGTSEGRDRQQQHEVATPRERGAGRDERADDDQEHPHGHGDLHLAATEPEVFLALWPVPSADCRGEKQEVSDCCPPPQGLVKTPEIGAGGWHRDVEPGHVSEVDGD